MCLSHCNNCQFFSSPQHQGDVGCAVNPSYWWLWYATSFLNENWVTLDSLPVDDCRDFQLKTELEPVEITLSLTPNQWQQLANNCSNPDLIEQISEYIELDTSAWIGVDSSFIEAIQYNNLTSTLLIRFDRGYIYQYDDVPTHIFERLRTAASHGRFFNRYIKDHYRFQTI